MLQTLQETTNFILQYDDSLEDSEKRAAALALVVESEFTALTQWFGITDGFGAGHKISVKLQMPSVAGALGDNGGYDAAYIEIFPQGGTPDDTGTLIVQHVFVAEFVEILMDKRDGGATWNPGYSNGEGLSQFCADLRFPDNDVRVNAWLETWSVDPGDPNWTMAPPRPDWISNTEKTDRNIVSFGCALLFLYYLKSQLNYSVPDIIQKGGSTLETTYKNLTGQTGGYAAFTALLAQFFPVGQNPTINLTTNNPFPLWPAGQRYLQLGADIEPLTPPATIASGTFSTILLGCPGLQGPFPFTIQSTPSKLICTASTIGFGQPQFKWQINGVDLPAGNSGTVLTTATVFVDNPSAPLSQTSTTKQISLTYSVSGGLTTSTLELDTTEIGHFNILIGVSGMEQFASADVTSTAVWIYVNNEKVIIDPSYGKRAASCFSAFENSIAGLVPPFSSFGDWGIIWTLPDPPPPEYARVAAQFEQLGVVLVSVALKSPLGALQLSQAIESKLGLKAGILGSLLLKGRGE